MMEPHRSNSDLLFTKSKPLQMEPVAASRASFIRRLLASKSGLIGLIIISIAFLTALVGPLLSPYDPIEQHIENRLQEPSSEHWLGTDEFGRDVFSRLLSGSRIAFEVGLIAVSISLGIGVAMGIMAGYFGKKVDAIVMRFTDVLLAFPYLLLAMMIVAILGPGITNAMIAIGIVYIPQYARLIRGSVLSVREMEFVYAARIMGASHWRLVIKHIFRNSYSPILVQASITFGLAIVETAGLGFLGLGAQPPEPEWGAMLSSGRNYMLQAPWIATFPGLAILITVIGFNLLGDGLRDVLDPKSKNK